MKFLSNLSTTTRERMQGHDIAPNNDAQMFENKKALRKKALEEFKAFKREFKLLRKEIKQNTKDIQNTEDTISKDFEDIITHTSEKKNGKNIITVTSSNYDVERVISIMKKCFGAISL